MGDVGRIKLAYGSEEDLAPGPLEGPSTVSLLAVGEVEGEEGGVDVVEDCESVGSDGEEEGEEEVVYPAEGKTVDEDAVLFQVTTPVKVTMPEAPPENSEVSGSHTHTHIRILISLCADTTSSLSVLRSLYVTHLCAESTGYRRKVSVVKQCLVTHPCV